MSVIADLRLNSGPLRFVEWYALEEIEDLSEYRLVFFKENLVDPVALPPGRLEAGTAFTMVLASDADRFEATTGRTLDATSATFSSNSDTVTVPVALEQNGETVDLVGVPGTGLGLGGESEIRGEFLLRTKVSSLPAVFDENEWEVSVLSFAEPLPLNEFCAGAEARRV